MKNKGPSDSEMSFDSFFFNFYHKYLLLVLLLS